jgi:acyl dehydratase
MDNVPLKERWFDDFRVGESFEFGHHQVTEQEIIDFARRYDPQPFHLDAEAAVQSHFGGLVASGWMTCGVLMRMLCDHFIPAHSSMGSPGIDELRWLKPVRPGDRLRARVEILDVKPSTSKPDRGVITVRQQLINQHDELVMSQSGRGMYKRRP